jgi:hypothetical protein
MQLGFAALAYLCLAAGTHINFISKNFYLVTTYTKAQVLIRTLLALHTLMLGTKKILIIFKTNHKAKNLYPAEPPLVCIN